MTLFEDLKLQYKIDGITIKFIFWNIILFVVPEMFFAALKWFNINIDYVSFISISSDIYSLSSKPWSLISYAFFHNDIFHILFNMMALYYIGRLFLTFFKPKQFVGVYILGTIFSGLIYILGYSFLPFLNGNTAEMVGASGAIMAILFATVTYQPLMNIWLFSVWKLELWKIAFLFVFIDFIQLSIDNTGGHIAHLAGAFFGFLFIKLLKKGIDLSNIVTKFVNFFVTLFKKSEKKPFKKVQKNYNKPTEKPIAAIKFKDKTQQQIDEILDKISKSGYDSLSVVEKEFLFKAGK